MHCNMLWYLGLYRHYEPWIVNWILCNVWRVAGVSQRMAFLAWLPKRYVLSIMVFWGFFTMYALRVNLNVAIGAMVHNHTVLEDGETREKVSSSWKRSFSRDNFICVCRIRLNFHCKMASRFLQTKPKISVLKGLVYCFFCVWIFWSTIRLFTVHFVWEPNELVDVCWAITPVHTGTC